MLCFSSWWINGSIPFCRELSTNYKFANAGHKGPVKINEVFGISPGLFSFLLVIIAMLMFLVAEKAEKKFARPDITDKI